MAPHVAAKTVNCTRNSGQGERKRARRAWAIWKWRTDGDAGILLEFAYGLLSCGLVWGHQRVVSAHGDKQSRMCTISTSEERRAIAMKQVKQAALGGIDAFGKSSIDQIGVDELERRWKAVQRRRGEWPT